MKVWKRNLLIAYLVCSALLVIFFYIYMLGSSTAPFLKFLLFVLGLAVIAGLFVGIYFVIYAFVHEHATLHSGPDGTINIERSALESTARRAMASIPDISVQNVRANVIERKGGPVIDLTVTAIPRGAESLMATAGRIQTSTKRAVEAFTDHEVRYVAVNFVEPKKRTDVAAAEAAVDARAAAGYVPPRYDSSNEATAASDGQSDAGTKAKEAKPSFWDRAKARAEATRAKRDEDVVETEAVVETIEPVAGDGAQTTSDPQPAAEAVDANERISASDEASVSADRDENR